MFNLLATGYPSLDYIMPVSHSPSVGETALIDDVVDNSQATIGGCGTNVVVALSRLGLRSGLATIIGDDYEGVLYKSHVSRYRIDSKNIITIRQSKTSRSMLFRNPNGEYQNFFFAGAADEWDDKLHLSGLDSIKYALVTVGPYRYNEQFVNLVNHAGVPLIWQLKPDINAFPPDRAKAFLDASTVVFMNHIEAEFLIKAMQVNDISGLWNEMTKVIIKTQGEDGCTIYTPDSEQHVPAIPTDVVDTTGAGDGFTAGFIAGMIRDYDWLKCAQLGTTLASFVLERVGCQTNLPDTAQLEERYKQNFGDL